MGNTLPPPVQEDVEPEQTYHGRWTCPWPGCPRVHTNRRAAATHAASPHFRCTCGRYFARNGIASHIAQSKRFGHDHPPYPDLGR